MSISRYPSSSIIRLSPENVTQSRATKVVDPGEERRYQIMIGVLAALGVLYNALLAMAGAHGLPISPTTVMVVEPIILITALITVLRRPISKNDLPSLLLAFTFLIITIYLCIVNQMIFPDTMRNIAIITIFTMLGLRASFVTVSRTTLIITVFVLAILILEIMSTPDFVALLEPAQYFWKTRGLPIQTWDKSGLFGNALGFKGRFAFGLTDHRTSSLFLEQLSLANFGAILMFYVMSLWTRLPVWQRVFYIAVIALIVTTTSSRTSLILAMLIPFGYVFYPRMPRFLNVAIAPLIIVIAWCIEDPSRPYTDDFSGRLSLTVRTLKALDLPAALGMSVTDATNFADSGYTYFIYAASLPGLIALWMFVAFYIPQITAAQKRFAYSSNVFIASSLVVAGTSIFTIKIASILWLIAGFIRGQRREDEEELAPAVEIAPSRDGRMANALSWRALH
jgi:putative polymerase